MEEGETVVLGDGGEGSEAVISHRGGTVVAWKPASATGSVFFQQQQIAINGELKTRGGLHLCFPDFGPVPESFGLPQHGPLRNLAAKEICKSGGESVELIFLGGGMLGALNTECEVSVEVCNAKPNALDYLMWMRLLKPPQKEVWVTPGFHPYFRTPKGSAIVSAPVSRRITADQPKIKSERFPILSSKGVSVIVPGCGLVKMELLGNGWGSGESEVVIWRDHPAYLCVEPIVEGRMGSTGILLTEEWIVLGVRFSFSPEE